jgi:hypothetical protein
MPGRNEKPSYTHKFLKKISLKEERMKIRLTSILFVAILLGIVGFSVAGDLDDTQEQQRNRFMYAVTEIDGWQDTTGNNGTIDPYGLGPGRCPDILFHNTEGAASPGNVVVWLMKNPSEGCTELRWSQVILAPNGAAATYNTDRTLGAGNQNGSVPMALGRDWRIKEVLHRTTDYVVGGVTADGGAGDYVLQGNATLVFTNQGTGTPGGRIMYVHLGGVNGTTALSDVYNSDTSDNTANEYAKDFVTDPDGGEANELFGEDLTPNNTDD